VEFIFTGQNNYQPAASRETNLIKRMIKAKFRKDPQTSRQLES